LSAVNDLTKTVHHAARSTTYRTMPKAANQICCQDVSALKGAGSLFQSTFSASPCSPGSGHENSTYPSPNWQKNILNISSGGGCALPAPPCFAMGVGKIVHENRFTFMCYHMAKYTHPESLEGGRPMGAIDAVGAIDTRDRRDDL